MKKILKETLTQQDHKSEDMETRRNNFVLFNAPEIGKENAQERQNEEEVKFPCFCIPGLQMLGDRLAMVHKIIQLGRPSTDRNAQPRPLKFFLKNREDKVEIFRSLRKLSDCKIEEVKKNSAHDYSGETRENIR